VPPTVDHNRANILASLDDAVIVTDTAERVTYINPAAEDLTGLSAAHARHRPLAALFPRDTWIVDMTRETLATATGRHRGEGTLAGSTVSPRAVTVAISPLVESGHAAEGTVLVVRDVSYRRTLEEATRQAERASSLEVLSTGLAHEIKNPLGAIKGAAQLLQQTNDPKPETIREHMAVIVRETDRLTHLLDELRDLTHPPPVEFTAVNVHRVLHAVLDLARQNPEWRSTTVTCAFDPSLPDARANEAKLVQVFLNLILNGIQAMDGAGTLTISTRMVTEYHIRGARGGSARFLAVEIADTGPGLENRDSAELFAPYFTTKPRGSGLGLTISEQIVAQHGGRISLRAGRRSGTVARVLLPVVVPPRRS
jgi:two-component system nitrogen regulation sensor histidine kinase GlnL